MTAREVAVVLSAREKTLSTRAVMRYVRVGAAVRGSTRRVFLRRVVVPGGFKFLRADVEKFVRELSGRSVVLKECAERAAVAGEYPPVRRRASHSLPLGPAAEMSVAGR